MNERLHILLSGPGLIGSQHARLVQEHPECHLAAIVAPPSFDNMQLAKTLGAPLFTGVDKAFEAMHLDAAIISSPNSFHAEQATTCILNGRPALVEKPMTDSLETARELANFSEAQGVPILVGHHRTYSPLLTAAEEFLRSPEFGRPVALQGTALFYKPADYFAAGPWRTKRGGGPILINLIHEVGLMRFFFGEMVSVFAAASRELRGFEVEDSVAITLRFENGALGTFLLSDTAASNKSWEMTSGENPRYPHHPGDDCYHFAGTNGSLDFPSMKVRYFPPGTDASWWTAFKQSQISFERADPLRQQLDHFVDIVRGRAEPRVSARDGYRNMLVVQAINDAITSGCIVKIADVAH